MSDGNPYVAEREAEPGPAARGPLRPIVIAVAGGVDVLGRIVVLKSYVAALQRDWLRLPPVPEPLAGHDAELACAALGLPITVAAAAVAARLAPSRPMLHASLALAWPAVALLASALLPGPGMRHPAYVIVGLAAIAPAAFLGTLLGARRGRR